MAKKKGYIPTRIAEFIPWQGTLVTKVVAGASGWGITTAKVDVLTDAQGVYVPLYAAISNPSTKTKGAVQAHKDGLKAYKKVIRAFVKENLIANSAITAQEKIDMGLNPGGEHAKRTKILTTPGIRLIALGGLLVRLEFRVEGDESRPSIHPESDGLEIRMLVSPPPPPSFGNVNTIVFSKKANFVQGFEQDLAGQTLYVYARWKNNSDDSKSGPWSILAYVVLS